MNRSRRSIGVHRGAAAGRESWFWPAVFSRTRSQQSAAVRDGSGDEFSTSCDNVVTPRRRRRIAEDGAAWFNPSIAHQHYRTSEYVLEAPTERRGRYVEDRARPAGTACDFAGSDTHRSACTG